ncbi:carboxypeptidase-like regulatory domain-containing protein [Solitalea koreensis]|uniref:CarboxypepD_reg-like domain-containing protein n=1 Tax=Solitalea koreensis TaxID=543615 RepID=A0A521EEF2_9SPHI|nr:carboxypeptidase-like regulatory domain-containing protein [Solitalea koreensis]SMO82294.1 CarboxypepD_reg-like domain-containing protein [Solitalea koreensis]
MKINIPQPCSENWTEMSSSTSGRFCTSCQKEVIDFTLHVDNEIVASLNQLNGKICGRFTNDQLDRTLLKNKSTSVNFTSFLSILGSIFLFHSPPTKAAIKPSQLIQILPSSNDNLKKITPKVADSLKHIRGKVIDSDNYNNNISGVAVLIKGTNIETHTDENGEFTLVIPDTISLNAIILFKYIGFAQKELPLKAFTTDMEVVEMRPTTLAMGEVVVTPIVKKATFWGKIKRAFGVN